MELYVKISFIFIFYLFFLVFKHFLSDALILSILQLQTQQVMTSEIESHIEYLTDLLYPCANFLVEIDEKSIAIMAGFNTI